MLKILPVHQPLVHGYLHHAYPLSLFSADDQRLKNWAFSNYLQLYFNNDPTERDPKLNFYLPYNCISQYTTHPLFTVNRITKQLVEGSILNFIRAAIEQEFYVYTFVDEYYLSYSSNYERENYVHDIFINGYDEEYEQLTVSAFDNSKIFKTFNVPYHEFVTAYNATLTIPEEEKFSFFDEINLFKENEHYNYRFDIELVYMLLSDYLHGRNTSRRHIMMGNQTQFSFGTSTYSILFEMLENKIDSRAFHIFWEHKKCVALCLEELEKQYALNLQTEIQTYKTIESDAFILRNWLLKFQFTGNQELIANIRIKLEMIKDLEIKCLSRVVRLIDDYQA
ncbi:hypothetical protein [Paenibacillus kobensis]|uniref:hypothetical protein n=1 Tax=Paenibacillus kobensis TaxID=59841 RepID=UPI000FDA7CEA|nr:hypothetical protein [Paenibacillus kobensis]